MVVRHIFGIHQFYPEQKDTGMLELISGGMSVVWNVKRLFDGRVIGVVRNKCQLFDFFLFRFGPSINVTIDLRYSSFFFRFSPSCLFGLETFISVKYSMGRSFFFLIILLCLVVSSSSSFYIFNQIEIKDEHEIFSTFPIGNGSTSDLTLFSLVGMWQLINWETMLELW